MGVDLRTAVESGRRYRYPGNTEWRGPGRDNPPILGTSLQLALDDCWEIEPEPEKPRGWFLCSHESPYGSTAHVTRDDLRSTAICSCGEAPSGIHRRVHDADACDQLREAK